MLLADPEAKAVLDRHFPGVSTDPRIGMGKGMTLRSIQKFAPDMFTEEAMNAVDAELDRLQPAVRPDRRMDELHYPRRTTLR